MNMKIFLPIITGVYILLSNPLFSQVSSSVRDQITNLSDKFTQVILEGNISGLNQFYDVNAVQLPNYEPMIEGRKAIIDQELENRKKGYEVVSMKTVPLRFFGTSKSVVEVGTYEVSMIAPTVNELFKDSGSYLTLWVKKGRDYFVQVEMWNTDKDPLERYRNYIELGGSDDTAPAEKPKNGTPSGVPTMKADPEGENRSGKGKTIQSTQTKTGIQIKSGSEKKSTDPNQDSKENEQKRNMEIKVKKKGG
jgi:hypothetical protein